MTRALWPRSLVLVLVLPQLACSEPDEVTYDQDEVLAEAVEFASNYERLDAGPLPTTHLEGMGLASIWANAEAAELFRTLDPDQVGQTAEFPRGAILVKENFDMMGNPVDVINVMAKFEAGYDPDANDWFFAAIRRDGTIIDGIAGKGASVAGCRECHMTMGGDTDLVIGIPPDQLAP